ncbi:MAG: DUF3889 domain-containing protein [Ectobacillus sp.]
MKRFFIMLFICTLGCASYTYIYSPHAIEAKRQEPAYAKWGKLAVIKTKEKYPKAHIVDYLHIGRENKPNNVAIERFKLWLREGDKEYGVFIDITFNTKTETVLRITFKETAK